MLLRRYKNRLTEQRDKVPAVADKEKSLEEMSVDELIAYAGEHTIDIGKASSQSGILKKIEDQLTADDNGSADGQSVDNTGNGDADGGEGDDTTND